MLIYCLVVDSLSFYESWSGAHDMRGRVSCISVLCVLN